VVPVPLAPLPPRPVPLLAEPGVAPALPTVLPELLLLPMLVPGVVLGVAPGVVGALPAPSVVEPLLEPVVPVAGAVPMLDDDPIALVLSALPARAVFAQSGRVAPAPMLVLGLGLAEGVLVLELLELPGVAELELLLLLPGLSVACASARPEVAARAAAAASMLSLLLIFTRGSLGSCGGAPGRQCTCPDQRAASSRRIASR